MTGSIDDIEKKRGRGRPPTDATPVLVRLQPDLLSGLDELAAKLPDSPSRPEAIRRVLSTWLAAFQATSPVRASGGVASAYVPSASISASVAGLAAAVAEAAVKVGEKEMVRIIKKAIAERGEAEGSEPSPEIPTEPK